MTDSVTVNAIGKSEAEIAHQMATDILISIEKKKWDGMTRAEYLNAHVDAVFALRGSRPK